MEVSVPGDAVVVRFSPFGPERTLARARTEYDRVGHYRVSVFVGLREEGEDQASIIQRLLEAAELGGIQPTNNPKYMLCAEASKITAAGFTFHKYDEDDPDLGFEQDEHYSVDLGEEPTLEDAERFLEPFGSPVKREP